jgi:hypothetical protein
MKYGSSMLMISDRRFFKKMMKSARSSDFMIMRVLGPAAMV